MTHERAAEYAQQGAELISRLLRTKRIPQEDRSDACDIAIDLNNLAKHHAEAALREAPTAGSAAP
jgi:Holliday junction resolvasome RuvABC endonuclease subunit